MEKLCEIHLRLSGDDVELLDGARGTQTRSSFLRSLIRQAAAEDHSAPADRGEAIAILSEMARAGKVAAAIALERALRAGDEQPMEDRAPWDR
jgi:hypothetical protein